MGIYILLCVYVYIYAYRRYKIYLFLFINVQLFSPCYRRYIYMPHTRMHNKYTQITRNTNFPPGKINSYLARSFFH